MPAAIACLGEDQRAYRFNFRFRPKYDSNMIESIDILKKTETLLVGDSVVRKEHWEELPTNGRRYRWAMNALDKKCGKDDISEYLIENEE